MDGRDHHRRAPRRASTARGPPGAPSASCPPWATCTTATSRSWRGRGAECDVVAVTIFVNPLQFAAGEDLAAYPRDLDARPRRWREAAGVDRRASRPTVDEMYPPPDRHHGARSPSSPPRSRARRGPTHFAGVATVVAKLLHHRRAVPRLLRREGLPAARRRAPHGRRPVVAGRGGRLPHRARGRRPGHVEPQRLPHARRAGRGAGAAPRAAGRRGARSSRRAPTRRGGRRSWPTSSAAEPLGRARLRRGSSTPTRCAPRRDRRSSPRRERCACWSPPASAADPPPRQPSAVLVSTERARGLRSPQGDPREAPSHRGATTMRRRMMKSKIHRATVTDANLHYVGSITLDRDLMDAADIRECEQVTVVDIDNGARFETYAIPGGARRRVPQRRRRPPGAARRSRSSSSPTPTTRTPSSRTTSPASSTSTPPTGLVDEATAGDLADAIEVGPGPLRRGPADGRPARPRRRVGRARRARDQTAARDASRPPPVPSRSTCSSWAAGWPGLSAAVRAADTHGMRVGVLTKGELHQATTRWAQGGWPPCSARTPTPPTSTSPTRSRPAPGCATSTPCGCSSTRAPVGSTS